MAWTKQNDWIDQSFGSDQTINKNMSIVGPVTINATLIIDEAELTISDALWTRVDEA